MKTHAIQNFQIPVLDFERAKAFYGAVLDVPLQEMEFGDARIAVFPFDASSGGVGGTLIRAEGFTPAKTGTIVYLDAGDDLAPWLDRISKNGGVVVAPKTELGPGMGYYAVFDDTEGNRVGLYSKH